MIGSGAIGLSFLIFQLLAGSGGLTSDTDSSGSIDLTQGEAFDLSSKCRTGDDANQQEDCRVVGVINSVQPFWADELDRYQEAKTVFFTDATQTGCGGATSQVGPFAL